MNVLITGGAGYIGSHCNRYFNEKGIYTVIVDDLSDGHEESVVAGKFVKGSFGDRALMEKILKEEKIDAVIHFAAFASVPDSVARPSRYYHNNVSNMLNLLDAMVATGVKYIVFSSSAATFGEPVYTPIDEKHPQKPINPYGMTKLIGEKCCWTMNRPMTSIPVRSAISMLPAAPMTPLSGKPIILNVI